MVARQFTRLEQIGILAAMVVVVTFGYLKFINHDPDRKLKRSQSEYAKVAGEVERLQKGAESGHDKGAITRLRRQIGKIEAELEQTEKLLAQRKEKDRVANTIVKLATESGLLIKTFGEVTGKGAIANITGQEATPYPHKYYRFTLKGGFQDLRRFLGRIDDLPKLIAIRRIDIQKIEEEAYMRATVWIGI